jgi:hypothetical protein
MCYTMLNGMKNRSLTLPVLGIVMLTCAAYFAWPKMTDSSKPSQQQKFTPMAVATPHRERAKLKPQPKKDEEGPIKVSFKIKPSFVDPQFMKKG